MKRAEFSKKTKAEAFLRANGRCECGCGQRIGVLSVEYAHWPVAASLGGPNTLDNCLVMIKKHHRKETNEYDKPMLAKAIRIFEKRIGARNTRSAPIAGARRSGWKHKISGEWVKRDNA
jgi:5-methylcytosine-specific restriction enzyme A